MKKYGYKFRRNYSLRVMQIENSCEIKFGILSTRKQSGGIKQEDGDYLNPIQIKERLDDTTILAEDGRVVTVHKGITYLSTGKMECPSRLYDLSE